jgi:hypothetical protein
MRERIMRERLGGRVEHSINIGNKFVNREY